MKKLAKTIVVTILMLVTLVGCKKSNDVNPKSDYTDLKILSIDHTSYHYNLLCFRSSKNDTCEIRYDKVVTPDPSNLDIIYYDGTFTYDASSNQYIRNISGFPFYYPDDSRGPKMITTKTELFDVTVGSVIRLGFTF